MFRECLRPAFVEESTECSPNLPQLQVNVGMDFLILSEAMSTHRLPYSDNTACKSTEFLAMESISLAAVLRCS